MLYANDDDGDLEAWARTVDLVLGDLDLADSAALNIQLAGLVVGMIHLVVDEVPAMAGISASEYLQRLGIASENYIDPNQGKLF